MNNPHFFNVDNVLEALGSSANGLDEAEAGKRLINYGPNSLPEQKKMPPWLMFLNQFKDFMIVLLIVAAVISSLLAEVADTIAIIVIVSVNAIIGFVQEYRAEKAMEALKKMAAPTAMVKRAGRIREIQAEELVPGDIVLLEAGRVVPADLRLIESAMLRTAEAALTGESMPIEKTSEAISDEDLALADRRNMAYKGTQVVYGRGIGVVTATGMSTELGRIASLLDKQEAGKTPLQKKLAQFGKHLGMIAIAICALVFIVGLMRGENWMLMFLTSVSLAVAAVPEALPAVATITLALGAKKMVKANVLVRRLPAVETLGSVTFICSDKTGTLTQNVMRCEQIFVNGISRMLPAEEQDETIKWLFLAMSLSNDATGSEGDVKGEPTEAALYQAAQDAGMRRELLEKTWRRKAEIPFDSERKMMTTFHVCPEGGYVSFTKGACEAVSMVSVFQMQDREYGSKNSAIWEAAEEEMAKGGLRVLAFGMRKWKELPGKISPEIVERELTMIGLCGLMDPPRQEALDAVTLCKSAGITPVMITGDHPATALAIAKRLGMAEKKEQVLTGRELAGLSLEDFEKKVEDIRVYARVAPEQKVKIVSALQEKKEFVAMTGDGVNDAPALKRADIGVAMGITGTDVTKEAADMILLDDNFATIVRAVREGRRIFDNIRKFIKYTMTSNSGEIWTIFLAPLLGLPIPLLPIHILWINLVTDGLPGLALASEPAEPNIMNRRPRPPRESIVNKGLGIDMVWVGLLMGAVCIVLQAWAYNGKHLPWQTMVFTVLCLSQMGNALAIRSETQSIFRQGLLSNLPLTGAVFLTLVLQLATIYVPFLNPVFKTEPLSLPELMICLAASSVVFWAVEAQKFAKRKRALSEKQRYA